MPFQVMPRGEPTLEMLRLRLSSQEPQSLPTVRLLMAGGMPSEALRFEVIVNPNGQVSCSLLDRLQGLEEALQTTLSVGQVLELLSFLASTGLLDLHAPQPVLLPDSVLGVLQLDSKGWYFYADKDQAKAARDEPPAALVRSVAALVAIGARVLRLSSIDPNLVGDPSHYSNPLPS